jgi:hypothetical protein
MYNITILPYHIAILYHPIINKALSVCLLLHGNGIFGGWVGKGGMRVAVFVIIVVVIVIIIKSLQRAIDPVADGLAIALSPSSLLSSSSSFCSSSLF